MPPFVGKLVAGTIGDEIPMDQPVVKRRESVERSANELKEWSEVWVPVGSDAKTRKSGSAFWRFGPFF